MVNDAAPGNDAAEGILSSQSGLDFVIDPNDDSKIIAKVAGDPAVTDGLTIDFNIDVDPDSTNDEDTAMVVEVEASLSEVNPIDWSATEGNEPPFTFTMLASDPAGTVVGDFDVAGAANAEDVGGGATLGEFLDGILLDADGNPQAMFSVRGANGPATGGCGDDYTGCL